VISQTIDDDLVHTGFHIIDGFLDQAPYQALSQTIKNMPLHTHFKMAKVGRAATEAHHPTIRNDHISWLAPDDDTWQIFFAAINNIKTILNRSLFLGLDQFESHIAIYPPGHFYKKHVDQFKTTQNRRISCVYYFNDHWQPEHGGELTLYNQDNTMLSVVAPHGNRFICFNSELPHEVMMTYQTRYSIAGWLKTRDGSIHHNV